MKKNMLVVVLALFFASLTLASGSYSGSSFNQIKDSLYEKPRTTLPAYPGLSAWSIITNLIGSESRPNHGLGVQSRRVLVDESDIRDTLEPKWLHPRGACAEARWIITAPNAATGLFAAGVDVPAIVRLSTGDASSEYPTNGRIFGMAIKIFPTANKNQPVKTANIITLDQYGFERSDRKFVFVNEAGLEPVYFTNVAPAKSALGKFLSGFFDRFDLPNWARPLYATARAHVGGGELIDFTTPYEVRFVADHVARPSRTFTDFRQELKQSGTTTLSIVLQSFDGRRVLSQKIGRLEMKNFIVSDFCDLSLSFHHSPIEDQWEKYTDYRTVEKYR